MPNVTAVSANMTLSPWIISAVKWDYLQCIQKDSSNSNSSASMYFITCGMHHYYIYERNVAFKQKWLINYSAAQRPNLNRETFFSHAYLLCVIGFKHAECANIHHKLLINIRMGERKKSCSQHLRLIFNFWLQNELTQIRDAIELRHSN